ncbi:MAG: hypothetical protein R3314_05015 [Longimicrobiales bacterium]|nr:hypothetical protein [Longimicrobiales bacterium]
MSESTGRMESRWIRAIPIGLLAGVVGAGAGIVIGMFTGRFDVILIIGVIAGVAGYGVSALVIETTGELAARIYGGGDTGTKREYSIARMHAVRGHWDQALAAYEQAAVENPADPEPLIRGAEVLRDGLDEPDRAVEWLLRARAVPRLEPGEDITIARELVELYEGPVSEPAKALPELARLVETYPRTRTAEWAWNEMTGLREALRTAAGGADAPETDTPDATRDPDHA